ncbi:Small GTPase superfamily [Pelomyxa schiedti]|nr:Small GTPase superfamily [Pelomyxa schiedti]
MRVSAHVDVRLMVATVTLDIDWLNTTSLPRGSSVETTSRSAIMGGSLSEATGAVCDCDYGSGGCWAEVCFPLSDGASVIGYAVDYENAMLDAVICPKTKVRAIFEQETRQNRASSALHNLAGGNAYSVQLYPFNHRMTRRVRISYICKLFLRNTSCYLEIPLPITSTAFKLPQLEVEAKVQSTGDSTGASLQLIGITCNKPPPEFEVSYVSSDLYHVVWDADQLEFSSGSALRIEVTMPVKFYSDSYVAAGQCVQSNESYFCVRDPCPPCSTRNHSSSPRSYGILWDSSLSHSLYKVDEELMIDIVENLQNVTSIQLHTFACSINQIGSFSSEETDKIRRCVLGIEYQGGSDFYSLLDFVDSSKVDTWLLFSDGFPTIGLHNGKRKLRNLEKRVFTFSSQTCNSGFLSAFANHFGGCHFCIDSTTNISSIVDAIHRPLTRFLGMADETKTIVFHAYPEESLIPPNQQFLFAGHLDTGAITSITNIVLRFLVDGKEVEKSYPMPHIFPGCKNSILQLLFAQRKLVHLQQQESVKEKRYYEEIVNTSKQFGVVTRQTSFVMLTTLEQFLEHDIEPPDSLPQLQVQFQLLSSQRRVARELRKSKRKTGINAEWERVLLRLSMKAPPKHLSHLLLSIGKVTEDFDFLPVEVSVCDKVSHPQAEEILVVREERFECEKTLEYRNPPGQDVGIITTPSMEIDFTRAKLGSELVDGCVPSQTLSSEPMDNNVSMTSTDKDTMFAQESGKEISQKEKITCNQQIASTIPVQEKVPDICCQGLSSEDSTSLMKHSQVICHGGRNEFCLESKSTIGVEFGTCSFQIEKSEGKLQLWDTAGQQRFNALTRSFYRGAAGVIIVYDITKRKSFSQVPVWMAKVMQNCMTTIPAIVIVGNKSDLKDLREVSYSEGKLLANSVGAPFCEISCLTNENTHEVLQLLYPGMLFSDLDKLKTEFVFYKAILLGYLI